MTLYGCCETEAVPSLQPATASWEWARLICDQEEIVVVFGGGSPVTLRPDREEYTLFGPCHMSAIAEGQWVTACGIDGDGEGMMPSILWIK